MKNIIIILIASLSFVYCNEKEKIFYTAKFKNVNAGSAVLETTNNLNEELIEIYFSLKTRKVIDVFYKLRDRISVQIYSNDYSLKTIKKTTQQGRYKKIDEAKFDYENNIFEYNNKLLSINKRVYDPLSIITYLRNQTLYLEKEFNFDIYSKGTIKSINLTVIDEEVIKIKNKEYNCFVIGHKIPNQSEITLWVEKKQPYLPIVIHTQGKYGDIVLQYKSYKP